MYSRLADLENKTGDEVVALVTALPPLTTSLDLSFNLLYQKTGNELVAIVAAIPATVTSLDLSGNYFNEKTGLELVALISAIPLSITSLDLSDNSLGTKTAAELVGFLAALPATVRSLDFSANILGSKSRVELVAFIAAIPATLSSIDLSYNWLYLKTSAGLREFVATIPASISNCNLGGNNLHTYAIDELMEIFAVIPLTLSYLDLSGNQLKDEQVDAIISVFSVGIETLRLDDELINLNKYCVQKLVIEVAKLRVQIGIERLALDTIKPPIEICGKRLSSFIDFLEKENHPIADLICGLLLEGQIATTSDILENCSEYDQYMEKRTHDAISFYRKAAKDTCLKPMVEFLLRNIKTSCPSISVQNRLAFFDLAPEDNFDCEFNQAVKIQLGVVAPLLASFGVFGLSVSEEDEVKVRTSFEF